MSSVNNEGKISQALNTPLQKKCPPPSPAHLVIKQLFQDYAKTEQGQTPPNIPSEVTNAALLSLPPKLQELVIGSYFNVKELLEMLQEVENVPCNQQALKSAKLALVQKCKKIPLLKDLNIITVMKVLGILLSEYKTSPEGFLPTLDFESFLASLETLPPAAFMQLLYPVPNQTGEGISESLLALLKLLANRYPNLERSNPEIFRSKEFITFIKNIMKCAASSNNKDLVKAVSSLGINLLKSPALLIWSFAVRCDSFLYIEECLTLLDRSCSSNEDLIAAALSLDTLLDLVMFKGELHTLRSLISLIPFRIMEHSKAKRKYRDLLAQQQSSSSSTRSPLNLQFLSEAIELL